MKAAGIREFGDPVELLELPGPRALRPDEVLIDVRACGIGNWDEIVRTGGWDLGLRPPMALGVEAAGFVAAVADQVTGFKAGDRVTAYSLPLRQQGAWAERYVAAAKHVAAIPAGVPFDAAAVLPVPALTADQVIGDTLRVRPGQVVLVNGVGGVTGGLLVQLAAHRHATVIATAGPGVPAGWPRWVLPPCWTISGRTGPSRSARSPKAASTRPPMPRDPELSR